jgi:hypothetical protein
VKSLTNKKCHVRPSRKYITSHIALDTCCPCSSFEEKFSFHLRMELTLTTHSNSRL